MRIALIDLKLPRFQIPINLNDIKEHLPSKTNRGYQLVIAKGEKNQKKMFGSRLVHVF